MAVVVVGYGCGCQHKIEKGKKKRTILLGVMKNRI